MPDRGGGPTGPRIRVGRPSRRVRTLLMTLGVLAVLAMAFVMFAGFWTDWLWYRSVKYSSVFTTTLWTKIGLFFVFGVLMALAVGVNIWLAHRLRPPLSAMSMEQQSLDRYRMGVAPYKKWILLGITALVGLIAGASASGQWRTWLMWVNGVPFNQKDPQFHLDVSFYAFDLPWYRFLLGFGFAATILGVIAAALTHYLYGGLRITSPGARATAAATGHLSVLLGLFVALKAVAYWLDRYGLAVKSSDFKATDNWTGLRYVDANAYLPAKTILFCIAVICALLFFATLWRRTWQLPLIGFGLLVLSAVLIGGLYPAIVQQFQVKPNEQAKETSYIEKNIEATRKAYGIDGVKIDDISGTGTGGDAKQQRTQADSVASYRLNDPNVVSPTFQQLEQERKYYQFPKTLDIDRYNGQDTIIGLRELNLSRVDKKNWINQHFIYTHGYGAIAAKGTQIQPGSEGSPDFTEQGMPTTGTFNKGYEQRIYFGEKTTQYSIVGGPQKELDYEEAGGQKTYQYKGNGGIDLSNPLNRAAYAARFSEPQMLYSGAIGEGSKILYDRTPKERVEAVAPWLTIDGDAYPTVIGKRVVWVVDAYTTTNGYPYASRTTLGDTTTDALTNEDSQRAVVAQQNQVNYIRNSVKATVDAYDGSVNLYTWDEKDPVLKTWKKAFPDTVKAKADIPAELKEHLRYPQDLFKVQREQLGIYHVTNADQFYNASDVWQVPNDPTNRQDSVAVPPYYLSLKMPGDDQQRFSLTTTFTPSGRPNLAAYMAVDADASSDGYGTMRLLRVTGESEVDGPVQWQSKLSSIPAVQEFTRNAETSKSNMIFGNLLAVPMDAGFLYVEPIYVQGSSAEYPLLKKVAVSYGGTTAFEDTLAQALDKVFGVQDTTPQPPPDEGEDTTEPPPAAGDQTVQEAVADAQKAYEASQEALKKGDWEAYGRAQQDLEEALQRAAEARSQPDNAGGEGADNGGGDTEGSGASG
ncbi:UPF0182 family protein [Streptomyces sp. CA-288835]|uniref:UPF0182 family membrane protein n=1 Tax=Streptomyces sp. CA-288835 TaxID=3240069 RepID=UPI003D9113C5